MHVRFGTSRGPVYAVNGISFDIAPGETLGIVGESGCGKSVTSLALLGILARNGRVTQGRAIFDGRDLLTLRDEQLRTVRGREIAMIFQDPMTSLNPVLTIGRQIREALETHFGMDRTQADRRAADLLDQVGIPSPDRRLKDYPHQFSGGMRQRAMIAMALACEPKVLLADEPTTALDVMVQAQILELLVGLTDDFGLALVLVTHDLPVVAQVCERAAVMYAGEIVEEGPIDTLYHDPRHPYTRLLFAATPDLYVEGELASIPGVPPRLDRAIPGCPFAPRCDRAFEPCPDVKPRDLEVAPGHRAACHLNDPAVARAS